MKYCIFLEFLLNEKFLSEKDIDLLDIEISYKKLFNNTIDNKGEFYDAKGKIFKYFHKCDLEHMVIKHLNSFIDECENNYNCIGLHNPDVTPKKYGHKTNLKK